MMLKFFRLLLLFFCLAAGFGLLVGASARSSEVLVLEVKGAINPVMARYVERGISEAESRGAVAAVIKLDTPGGLDSSMREIIQRMLGAKVPVVVYVYPPGARAASAGAFITMASHVAAMSPNTTIGAAHPVMLGSEGQLEGAMKDKVVNDAVAYIKSLAESRGRNVEWAEKAVRESIDSHEREALESNVVEIIAPDLGSLLSQLDGREVSLVSGKVTLHTQGVAVKTLGMSAIERFLLVISDPTIAYILLSLAMTGIFFELANPGAIFPGVIGGICLLLAFYSLGMLPVNYAGVALIILAFILFVLEVFMTSHGLLAIGGIASLTMGSLILISSSAPYFVINRWAIAAMVTVISAFFLLVVGAVVQGQRRQPVTGREGIKGKVAVVRTPLNPGGMVFVEGELWSARLDQGAAEPDEEVIVTKVDGMKLWVTKKERRD